MDGKNNGKPCFLMDDLGGFTHPYFNQRGWSLVPTKHPLLKNGSENSWMTPNHYHGKNAVFQQTSIAVTLTKKNEEFCLGPMILGVLLGGVW